MAGVVIREIIPINDFLIAITIKLSHSTVETTAEESVMSPIIKISTAFAISAGLLSAGCTQAPTTPQNDTPTEATEVYDVTKIGGSTYIYEVEPSANKDITCFIASPFFSGSSLVGNLDCVAKPNAQTPLSRHGVKLHSTTQIGPSSMFYELTPSTRPDLRCFAVTSIFGGAAASGDIHCQPAPATAPPALR